MKIEWDGFDLTPTEEIVRGLGKVRENDNAPNMMDSRGVEAVASQLWEEGDYQDDDLNALVGWLMDLHHLGAPRQIRAEAYTAALKQLC